MENWKRLRGYAISVVVMCTGITLEQLPLVHQAPDTVLLVGSALAAVAIEAVGIHRDQIRAFLFRKTGRS